MGAQVAERVRESIEPVLKEHGIPGMAVAVTVGGQRYFVNFGVASRESGRKATEKTIFEIGSISKIFTATLAAYSEARGKIAFSDPVSRHWPELKGSRIGEVKLLELATYTGGGLPLQFPENVTNRAEMIEFYRKWTPDFAPSTQRRYSNPSIGLAGYVAGQSWGRPFEETMERTIFPGLGLKDSYIAVPEKKMGDYAFGYNAEGKPIRVSPGMLAAEAYGVKTTSEDLIGFVERIIDPARIQDATLRKAVARTREGFYRVGPMTQGLGWEMYEWPTPLDRLLEGNSPDMAMKAQPAREIQPPLQAREAVLLNKTGSTNGFGAYVAVAPQRKLGIVMLANKSYRNQVRVEAAYKILTAIEACMGGKSTQD
jgi:beta-lactamase class C